MAHGVLIYAEHRDGELTNGTWEAIAAGQAIAAAAGTDARAVIIGSNLADNASRIAAKALAEVITVEHDKLATYTPDGFTAALAQTITSVDPEWVVFSHTYHVRDFAPRVAARLDRVLIGDVIKFKSEGGITLVRQIFQGKINADVTCATAAPRMISFQAGSYRTDAAKDGAAPAPVRAHAVDLGAVEIRWTTEERFKEVKGAVDLTAAPRIVSVGRGSRAKRISVWCASSRKRSTPSSRRRGRSATTDGFRWIDRSAVRDRPSRRSCTWRLESRAQFSTSSG